MCMSIRCVFNDTIQVRVCRKAHYKESVTDGQKINPEHFRLNYQNYLLVLASQCENFVDFIVLKDWLINEK